MTDNPSVFPGSGGTYLRARPFRGSKGEIMSDRSTNDALRDIEKQLARLVEIQEELLKVHGPKVNTILHKMEPKPRKKRTIVKYTPDFTVFWKNFPTRNGQKVGKFKAFTEWRALGLDHDTELRERIMTALNGQVNRAIASKGKGEFYSPFPDAERWLRDRKWEDD